LRPRVGWDVAAGFDYRFAASPWHVSGQVRYGQGRSSTGFANSFSGPSYYPGSTVNVSQATTSVDRESHWLADFAVGRDLNIGANPLQVKAGIRIAQLTSTVDTQTNGTASFTGVSLYGFGFPVSSFSELYSESNLQKGSFRGGGPRLGFEGAVPLGSRWQFDYLADAALLFGMRRIDNPVTIKRTLIVPGLAMISAFSTNSEAEQHGAAVPNLDAQVGFSYWLEPNVKVTASYRADAYFGAISTFDPNGEVTKLNRIFHGPRLALSGILWPEMPASRRPAGLVYKAAVLKAPPAGPKGKLQVFVDGGAFWTGGDPIYTGAEGFTFGGLVPGFFALKPKVGWDTAGGFDYRLAATPWHLSGRFELGQAKSSASTSSSLSVIGIYSSSSATDLERAAHTETHWVADFAVGRDFAIGHDTAQAKLGIRVADLTAKTSHLNNLTALYTAGLGATAVANFDNEQTSHFRGVGPRIGVEGAIPLRGGFSFDYLSDVAVLFATGQSRQFIAASSISVMPGGPSTTTVTAGEVSQSAVVPNADIQAGLSYWVNQNLKLSAAYRLDAYFGVLKVLDAEGNLMKADRYFHGPRVAATVNF
jgi:Legionella pneumophila major outer membrane protein precursor